MVQEITFDLARKLLPPRPPDGHKGTFGHAVVIAGARGFTGAPRLAALAANRAGAGLVSIAAPAAVADFINLGVLEVMCRPLPDDGSGVLASAALQPALDFVAGKDAVALGPGLTTEAGAACFVRDFAGECPLPLVIDADGLNALAAEEGALARIGPPHVLTPHPGEMARLIDSDTATVQGDREGVSGRFVTEHGGVLVLKGYRTLVAEAEAGLFVNVTGGVGLATGGTGDVLTGIIVSLLAQGLSPLDAARLGVFVHGLAGDIAAREKTARGLVAGDVIEALPRAWHVLEEGSH